MMKLLFALVLVLIIIWLVGQDSALSASINKWKDSLLAMAPAQSVTASTAPSAPAATAPPAPATPAPATPVPATAPPAPTTPATPATPKKEGFCPKLMQKHGFCDAGAH